MTNAERCAQLHMWRSLCLLPLTDALSGAANQFLRVGVCRVNRVLKFPRWPARSRNRHRGHGS